MRVLRTPILFLSICSIATAQSMVVEVINEWPSFCGAPTGRLYVSVDGGTPPYTILWSTGSDEYSISGLEAGTYSVTVTDANQEEQTAFGEVPFETYDTYGGGIGIGPPQSQGWCVDAMPHVIPWGALVSPSDPYGPGPWSYSVNGVATPTVPNSCPIGISDVSFYLPLDYPAGTLVSISYSDGNGCSGSTERVVRPPIPEVPLQVLGVSGSCSGVAQGSVVVATGPWDQPAGFGFSVGIALRTAGGDFLEPACTDSGVQDAWSSGSIRTFTGLEPGDYEVVVRPSEPILQIVPDYASCQFVPFTVPDLGGNCGSVTGRAFMDYNLNCTRQSNEPYVPGGIMEVLPGPYYAATDAQGSYTIALPAGSYTVQQQSELLGEHCTGGPIPFTISGGQTTTVDHPDTSSVPLDVNATLSSGIARPGFEFQYGVSVRNLTPASSGSNTITFTFDPTLTYLSATPNPSNVSGNTITWNQGQLAAFQQRNYFVQFQVPPDVGLLGYVLEATASIGTANADGDLSNNSATNLRTITGAYDPNDKLATTSSGNTSVWLINEDEWIDYTIRFQNTGTDTAFFVVITDTLPPNLDPGTFQAGVGSHTHSVALLGSGILRWSFPNILLPDSNVNEPRSHGFVTFRIRPRLPLLPGDEITNIANIYFDFNPPVITEPSVLVAEFSTGVGDLHMDGDLLIWPNPTEGTLFIRAGSMQFLSGRVRIHASNGRVVLEQGMNGNSTSLDLRHLAPGMYAVECIDQQGQRSTARFIRH